MEIEEAVKMAIENEVKGREMYLSFANRAKNSVTKKTFEFLADEELRHIDKIKEIAKDETGLLEVPDLQSTSLEKMKEIFGLSIKDFDKQATPDSDDIKAHEIGMELERKSFDFYKELSEEAADEKIRIFFDALMKEENSHYEMISKGYDFIKNPEGFYSEEEGWLLEGG